MQGPTIFHFGVALTCAASALSSQAASAEGFRLDGLWFEAENYPASSVMRFSPSGEGWIGRYVQVSPPQKDLGFTEGETVIRGKMEDSNFVGQVLLKPIDRNETCTNLTVGWVPIKMSFDGTGKLTGAWLQTWTNHDLPCVIVKQTWQTYRLERLTAR